MNNDEIILQLRKSLENISNDLKSEYRKKRRASGSFEKDLEVKVFEQNNKVIGKLLGSEHSYYVFHGRNAGRFPNIQRIREWVIEKNIKSELSVNSLAYVIGRSISEKGTLEKGLTMQTALKNSIEENFSQLEKTILQITGRKITSGLITDKKNINV